LINLQLVDKPTKKDYLPPSVENEANRRSKEAKQRTNTRFGLPDQAKKRIGRCGGRKQQKEGEYARKRDEQRNNGSGFISQGKPRQYQESWIIRGTTTIFEPADCLAVKVARIDRTAGLASTTLIISAIYLGALCTDNDI